MTTLIAILFFLGALVVNAPWMLAFGRGHQHRWSILLVQIFFGWTVLGWVISLIWSTTGKSQNSRSNWTCVQVWVFFYFLVALGLATISSSTFSSLRSTDPGMKIAGNNFTASTDSLTEASHNAYVPESAVEDDVTGHIKAPEPRALMYPTSFDCSGKLTPDEHLICTDPDLASEDQSLAAMYEDLRAEASPENRARIAQNAREQLIAREACSTRVCILDWYHDQEAWARASNAKMKGYL